MTSPVEIYPRHPIEAHPVVVTGHRWPCAHEILYGADWRDRFLEEHPELAGDARRHDLLLEPTPPMPEPGASGGGLFPVVIQLDDGALAAVTRTGAPHIGSGGELSLSLSNDGGRTWSAPAVVARGDVAEELGCLDAALGQAGNGDLVLVYGLDGRHDTTGRPTRRRTPGWSMRVTRSPDRGRSWSESVELEPPPEEPALLLHPYGQMRRLFDHTLVFNARGWYRPGAYEKHPGLPARMSYLYRSHDEGHRWGAPQLVAAGKTETAFLPLDEANWLAYARVPQAASQFARSSDHGQSWHGWEPALPGPAGTSPFRHPGSITRLQNGNVLVTYGHRQCPFGVRAIVSRDGGRTFDRDREYVIAASYLLEDGGYPSTVCLDDGMVVTLAYTVFDLDHPDWGTCCVAYRYPQELFDL